MQYVFVSSWSHGAEQGGLAQYVFAPETGALKYVRTLNTEKSCGASWVDAKRNVLYVLNEKADLDGQRAGGGGEILTYRLNAETGEASLLEATPTHSSNPAQLSVDATGRYLVVANHGSRAYVTKLRKDAAGRFCTEVLFDDAAVELFSLRADGSIEALLDADLHTGSGPQGRQLSPHPHCAEFSPSGRMFAVCDKGNDKVYLYTIDRENGALSRCGTPATAPAGSMPRYGVFHPTLPVFYHNNEGSLDIHAYRYDETGALEWAGAYGAGQSPNDKGEQQGICMDSSGRYLYDVLNGPNQLAVFRIDQTDGTLQRIQNLSLGYPWPRSAVLSPDGAFLLVACLKGERILVLRVEPDGTLTPTGYEYEQPCAAYASFWDTERVY
ncbi:MAG: lactonase family protein [Oscillospiraceae bacterium]|nr:lactonase family protein [Oscillospiraceae bacterium]